MSQVYSEANGYACMFEVSSGTGTNATRAADIVVLNLWPSRGMDLNGYEVKTARSDWLRELKQPEKAWPVMKYMDRWWLLASPGVAKLDEIPTNWGFMEFNGVKTRVLKPAPKLEPVAVTKTFLGAMLRKPIRDLDAEVARRVATHLAEHREKLKKEAMASMGRPAEELQKLTEKLSLVERETGIDLLGWKPADEQAAALKFALKSNAMGRWGGLDSLVTTLHAAAKAAESIAKEVRGDAGG
jgi:hypothetical protein